MLPFPVSFEYIICKKKNNRKCPLSLRLFLSCVNIFKLVLQLSLWVWYLSLAGCLLENGKPVSSSSPNQILLHLVGNLLWPLLSMCLNRGNVDDWELCHCKDRLQFVLRRLFGHTESCYWLAGTRFLYCNCLLANRLNKKKEQQHIVMALWTPVYSKG